MGNGRALEVRTRARSSSSSPSQSPVPLAPISSAAGKEGSGADVAEPKRPKKRVSKPKGVAATPAAGTKQKGCTLGRSRENVSVRTAVVSGGSVPRQGGVHIGDEFRKTTAI